MRKRALTVMFPNAAGIDVGSASHYVAVPAERCEQSVREFESFTEELIAMAAWLETCAIDTVVMESTGVYWIPLYDLLERAGFRVLLVDPRQGQRAPNRPKTDVHDCQGIQRLHSLGLLTAAFRPEEPIRVWRS